jgi:hypothetical protein
MTSSRAYSFKTKLSLDALMNHLNTVGPWKGRWVEGDSARHGDYLGVRAVPYDAVVRIYQEADHFIVQAHRAPSLATASEIGTIITSMRNTLLPAIDAQDIAPHEGID